MIDSNILSLEFIKRTIVGALFAGCTLSIVAYAPPLYSMLYFALLMLLIVCTEWPIIASRGRIWFLSLFYPIFPAILIILTPQPLLFTLISIAFTFDACAYLTGTLLGYTPFAPSISKNKTVEGCIGGLIGLTILLYMIIPSTFLSTLFSKALLCSIMAMVGDLFESWLKRRAHIKDAGYLLPGHGGLLDRFDSIFFLVLANHFLHIFST